MIGSKTFLWVSAFLLTLCGAAWAQDKDAPTAPAPVSTFKRLLEPESGLEFALDSRWSGASGGEGLAYQWLGKDVDGLLEVRFPLHFKEKPASATELLEAEKAALPKRADWKLQSRKFIEEPPPKVEGLTITQLAFTSKQKRQPFLERRYYVSAPYGGVVAIRCRLPKDAVATGDPCDTFLSSAKVLLATERDQRLAALSTIQRLEDDAAKPETPCLRVQEENREFRALYPNAELKQIPRFKHLYVVAAGAAFKQTDPTLLARQLQGAPKVLDHVDKYCAANPDKTFADAIRSIGEVSPESFQGP